MIELNTDIVIVPSDDLAGMHLSGIIGRTGRIAEQVFSNGENLIGYMVFLDKSFQGESLWFIPTDAVEDEEGNQ